MSSEKISKQEQLEKANKRLLNLNYATVRDMDRVREAKAEITRLEWELGLNRKGKAKDKGEPLKPLEDTLSEIRRTFSEQNP